MFYYNEQSGQIKFYGCVESFFQHNANHKFDIGDILYAKHSAQLRGKIEKICIKKINYKSQDQYVYLLNYVDTYNRVWFEHELVNYTQAKKLIVQYEERKAALAMLDLKNKGCI